MAHFFRAYLYLILPVVIACTVLIGKAGLGIGFGGCIVVSLFVNIIPSALVVMFSDKMGSFAGKLYTGGNTRTPSEEHSGLLDQARYMKSKQQYDDALETIDGFLEHVPGYPEALFVKAQILWEGKRDAQSAKQCLLDLIKSTDDNDQWHRWAETLLRDVVSSK